MHKIIGAIIKNDEGEILMIERNKKPFGWACPSGHTEKDETILKAVTREVREEIGLEVKKCKLLKHEFVDWNVCDKGEKGHDWNVFEVLKWEGDIILSEESKNMKWVSVKDLGQLDLEPVWKYWFEKLKLI